MSDTIPLIVRAGNLEPLFCPDTEQERLDAYAEALSVEAPAGFGQWIFGPTAPSIENRDKKWFETAANGDPVRAWSYSTDAGLWVSRHPSPPATSGERRLYVGTSTALLTYDGGASATVTLYTGPMWEIDTGFADRVPAGVGSGITAVAADQNILAAGTDALVQVRGVYVIKRTARTFYTRTPGT